MDNFPAVLRIFFLKGQRFQCYSDYVSSGLHSSKQRRIELLYRYKQAKPSKITGLNIQKFTLSGARQLLWKMMRAQHLEVVYRLMLALRVKLHKIRLYFLKNKPRKWLLNALNMLWIKLRRLNCLIKLRRLNWRSLVNALRRITDKVNSN